MGKASVGLLAGYWPENVYRYVDVPFWSLDVELVEEPAKKWAEQPALATAGAVVTYRQLHQHTERIAGALQARLDPGARVALCMQSPLNFVTALLGALGGGYTVYLVHPQPPPSHETRALAGFKAGLFLCDEAMKDQAQDLSSGVPVAVYESLLSGDAPKRPASVDTDSPAIFLSGADGAIVSHSHHSLLAGALSWATFSSLETGQAVLSFRPPQTWDGLYWALATLYKGALCLFIDLGSPSLAAAVQQRRPTYAVFDMEGLERAIADPALARVIGGGLSGAFVPVEGPFSPEWRRRARNRLGADVLTVYGSAKLGAVLASHPSWYADAAVGIPVTNVDLWPLDPASREALDVSWEAIEFAEIGVKSPMVAPAVFGGGDKWVPAGLIATMDTNGFYYLLERPVQWLERLGLAIPLLDRPTRWLRRLASVLPFPGHGRRSPRS